MANGWTPERRARQRALIEQWRPWEKSTGPRTDEGKAIAAQNALVHGGRCREWLDMLKRINTSLREQREALRRARERV